MRISSKNIKICIIGDIHLKYELADKIIEHESPDKIICIGDYFDNYGDTVIQNQKTAIWLKTKLNCDSRFIGLQGNHDNYYRYHNIFLKASGYTPQKDLVINKILDIKDWDKLRYCIMVDDFLLTHAGLHSNLIPSYLEKDQIYDWLCKEIEIGKKLLDSNKGYWIYDISYRRGGWASIGGIFWCDFREFIPTPKINQIMGHTRQKDGKVNTTYEDNFCIDTGLREWITITNGKLEIKNLSKLLLDDL